jgi:hypothetical protein
LKVAALLVVATFASKIILHQNHPQFAKPKAIFLKL